MRIWDELYILKGTDLSSVPFVRCGHLELHFQGYAIYLYVDNGFWQFYHQKSECLCGFQNSECSLNGDTQTKKRHIANSCGMPFLHPV